LVLFCQSQPVAGKPSSHCVREADHGFAHLYRSTLTHPLGKEEGWKRCTTLDGRVSTISGELLAGDSSGSPCPFDRGRLAAAEALSKSAKELSYGSRLYLVGSEGSMPPSEGIPLSTSPLASNMSEGILRKWFKPWPCTGPLSDIPYSVYSRAAVKPRSRASFRTLEVYSGLEARGSFAWKCLSISLPSRSLGCVFLGGKQKRRGSGRRGRRLSSGRLTHACMRGFRGSS
jgi:hypothetical protein